MGCKYCNVKALKEGQVRLNGSYPTGEPIFAYRRYPSRYVFIAHWNGCPAMPDEDKWVLEFMENWDWHLHRNQALPDVRTRSESGGR